MYKDIVKDEVERREEQTDRQDADGAVTLKDSTSISGELIAVDDSITVYSDLLSNQVVACNNIQTVVVRGESNMEKAAAIGTGIGVFVGGTLALVPAGDDHGIAEEFVRRTRVTMIAGGAVAGFAVGFVVGLASSDDEREFTELTPQNLMALKSLARYSTIDTRAAGETP